MKLYQFDIPKSKLYMIEKNERIFLVQLMNASNEIYSLQKLSYIAGNNIDAGNDVVKSAQVSQAILLQKILALKLWECWKLIAERLLDSDKNLPGQLKNDIENMSERYSSLKDTLENFEKLKTYLEMPIPKNKIKLVRHRFAAHCSEQAFKMIGQLIDEASESTNYQIFFSEIHSNCFYKMAHDLSDGAMLELIKKDESQEEPMKVLMEEIQQVIRLFLEFVGSYIMVVIFKNFGFEHTEIEIPEPMNLNEIDLPYFIK